MTGEKAKRDLFRILCQGYSLKLVNPNPAPGAAGYPPEQNKIIAGIHRHCLSHPGEAIAPKKTYTI
ncbi:MAG: hypothetical protein RLZ62_1983 [Bacteroidota bacterium]|jgi:hypothetical protein